MRQCTGSLIRIALLSECALLVALVAALWVIVRLT